eukprot:403362860
MQKATQKQVNRYTLRQSVEAIIEKKQKIKIRKELHRSLGYNIDDQMKSLDPSSTIEQNRINFMKNSQEIMDLFQQRNAQQNVYQLQKELKELSSMRGTKKIFSFSQAARQVRLEDQMNPKNKKIGFNERRVNMLNQFLVKYQDKFALQSSVNFGINSDGLIDYDQFLLSSKNVNRMDAFKESYKNLNNYGEAKQNLRNSNQLKDNDEDDKVLEQMYQELLNSKSKQRANQSLNPANQSSFANLFEINNQQNKNIGQSTINQQNLDSQKYLIENIDNSYLHNNQLPNLHQNINYSQARDIIIENFNQNSDIFNKNYSNQYNDKYLNIKIKSEYTKDQATPNNQFMKLSTIQSKSFENSQRNLKSKDRGTSQYEKYKQLHSNAKTPTLKYDKSLQLIRESCGDILKQYKDLRKSDMDTVTSQYHNILEINSQRLFKNKSKDANKDRMQMHQRSISKLQQVASDLASQEKISY